MRLDRWPLNYAKPTRSRRAGSISHAELGANAAHFSRGQPFPCDRSNCNAITPSCKNPCFSGLKCICQVPDWNNHRRLTIPSTNEVVKFFLMFREHAVHPAHAQHTHIMEVSLDPAARKQDSVPAQHQRLDRQQQGLDAQQQRVHETSGVDDMQPEALERTDLA
jgi:hypothetical protein